MGVAAEGAWGAFSAMEHSNPISFVTEADI
jgi:hypothetical protein